MSHCKMTALALVATGALTITTMVSGAYAINARSRRGVADADALRTTRSKRSLGPARRWRCGSRGVKSALEQR